MSASTATHPALFGPDTVASINRAYAKACGIVADRGGRDDLRSKVGRHMMDLARSGERDEARLCKLAVLAVFGREAAALCPEP